jgi:hypothetical protein
VLNKTHTKSIGLSLERRVRAYRELRIVSESRREEFKGGDVEEKSKKDGLCLL